MAEEQKQYLDIQRIYVKDLSLEIPASPQIFCEKWEEPEANLDLNIKYNDIDNDYFEVILSLTVSSEQKDKVIFLVELQQAGIFHVVGFESKEREHILNIYCPNVLFPYAREVIANIIMRASFPPLHLSPINFEALYQQRQDEKSKAKEAEED